MNTHPNQTQVHWGTAAP